MVANKVRQRLAGELFDDVAFDVHRHAVGPALAGLIEQRNLRQLVDEFLKVLRTQKLRIAIHLVDWRIAEKAIRESGGVRHQLAHGGLMFRIDKDHLAVGVHAVDRP